MTRKLLIIALLSTCFLSAMFSQDDKASLGDSIFTRGYIKYMSDGAEIGNKRSSDEKNYGIAYFGANKKLSSFVNNFHSADSSYHVTAVYDKNGELSSCQFYIHYDDDPIAYGNVSKDKDGAIFWNYEFKPTGSSLFVREDKQTNRFPKSIVGWNFSDYVSVDALLRMLGCTSIKPPPFPQRVKFRAPKKGEWAIVNANGVGVRDQPNMKGKVLEAWSTGKHIWTSDMLQADSIAPWGHNHWYKVRWDIPIETEYGYVFGAFFNKIEEEVPSKRIISTKYTAVGGHSVISARTGMILKYRVQTKDFPDGYRIRVRIVDSKEDEIIKDFILTVNDNISESESFIIEAAWMEKVLDSSVTEIFEE